jgi:hypothetical protein
MSKTGSKLALIIVCNVFTSLITYAQRQDFWDINFHKADSIASVYENRDLKNPEKLADDLAMNLTTDVEKFRAIFRWITDNIHYDLNLYNEVIEKQRRLRHHRKKLLDWKKQFDNKVQRRLYNKQSTICDGYASLLERMSNHVGISCVKISGYARTSKQAIGKGQSNHAWNAVKIGARWYLCDATWASSKLDPATLKFHRRFDRNYFLTDPSLFIANHFPSDTSWILLHDKPSLKEFLNGPMKYGEYIASKVSNYSPKNGIVRIAKGSTVTFEFSCNVDLEKNDSQAHLFISSAIEKEEIKKRISQNSNGLYSITHTFENRGAYEVNATINGKEILTYRVYTK